MTDGCGRAIPLPKRMLQQLADSMGLNLFAFVYRIAHKS